MSSAWSSKGDLDSTELDHDKYHRHYTLHADRDSAYGSDNRYPSPERRPRHHSRDVSPSHRCRPASYTRDGNMDDNHHYHHRHHNNTRPKRGRERGRGDSRPIRERHNEDSRRGRSGSLQGLSTFLQRLGIIDDDPFAESVIEEKYEVQRRPHQREHHQRQHHHQHHHHSDRDSDYTRTPSPSPSRSPSRRRDVSSFSDRGSAAEIVTRHDNIHGRGQDSSRDRSRDRRHHDNDNYNHPNSSRKLQTSRARSVPSRSNSHSRSRRRPSLKRGPPSSSSTTSSNSSSRSDPSSSSSKWESAARNALRAGTMAALSSHGAPGSWLGNKGTRVATAALGAALVDTYMGHRHPNSMNGIRHTAMRQAAEYAISSIVAEPIMERATRRKTSKTRR